MKKILILNTVFDKGGAARIAKDIFTGLSEDKNFEIFFAYGRGVKTNIKNTFYFGNNFEFIIHTLIVRLLGIEGIGSFFASKKLIAFIKRKNIDIIHIHNLHGYYVNYKKLINYLNKKNIKIIYTFHDEWTLNTLLAYSTECIHCRTGKGKCSSLYNYPKSYINIFNKYNLNRKKETFLSIKNLIIITPSEWLAKQVKESFLKEADIKVINNGIDTHYFKKKDKEDSRKNIGLPLDKKILLFIANGGRKNKIKGWSYVEEVLNNDKYKDFLFLSIGENISGVDKKYSNLINIKTIKDKLLLSQYFSASDVLLFPSLADNFPTILLETLSVGLPSVVFKIGGIPEIVNHRENGYVVEYKDLINFKIGINYLVNLKKEERNMILENSINTIKNNFSKEKMINKYKEVYYNF